MLCHMRDFLILSGKVLRVSLRIVLYEPFRLLGWLTDEITGTRRRYQGD